MRAPVPHVEGGVEISHAYGAIVEGNEVSYIENYFAHFRIRGPQLAAGAPGRKTRTAAINNLVAFYERSGTRVKASDGDSELIVQNNLYRFPLDPGAPDVHLLLADKGGDPEAVLGHTKLFVAENWARTAGPRTRTTGRACRSTLTRRSESSSAPNRRHSRSSPSRWSRPPRSKPR